MTRLMGFQDNFKLVDLIGLNYEKSLSIDMDSALSQRWDDTFRAIMPRTRKYKYKSIHINHQRRNIQYKNILVWYLIDFSRFSKIINRDFPKGNQNAFFKIVELLYGNRYKCWAFPLGHGSNKNIIATNSLMSQVLFSIIMASWKYCCIVKSEENSQKSNELENDIKNITNASNIILATLNKFNDDLFEQAYHRANFGDDINCDNSNSKPEGKLETLDKINNFKNYYSKYNYIEKISLLPKIMHEIELDLKALNKNTTGTILDRLFGGPNLLLFSKANLLVDCYATSCVHLFL